MRHVLILSALFSLLLTPPAFAGVYTDDLTRCLVKSSTDEDKLTFIRWMFTAMARHPAVGEIAEVTPADSDAATRAVAKLYERLLTDVCRTQSVEAVRYEGAMAMQASFEVLGKVAATDLFTHPQVAEGLASMGKHMDLKKIQKVLGLKE